MTTYNYDTTIITWSGSLNKTTFFVQHPLDDNYIIAELTFLELSTNTVKLINHKNHIEDNFIFGRILQQIILENYGLFSVLYLSKKVFEQTKFVFESFLNDYAMIDTLEDTYGITIS